MLEQTTRLAEIEAREAAATPGPWEPCPSWGQNFYANSSGSYLRGVGTINFGDGADATADLAFTLAARDDVPFLLAQLRQRDAEIAELQIKLAVRERQLDDMDAAVIA
ncbi:hypothetical protein [Streptomyces sp. NPDC005969]|uniref:hypothetical protein n=1 Tax=Streptomyces sp. NPDC005969 TaxID=3156722 RepID=UPI0033C0C255